MSAFEQQFTLDSPNFVLPQHCDALLAEAVEKTGKSPHEILQFCLEHGIQKILEETESEDSNRQLHVE